MVLRCLEAVERNYKYQVTCCGEPQLGKRGLYPTVSTKSNGAAVRVMMDLLAYADGRNDLIDIANRIGVPVWDLFPIVSKLEAAGLLRKEGE